MVLEYILQKSINEYMSTLKQNTIVRRQGNKWRVRRVIIPYVLYLMINKLIIYVLGLVLMFHLRYSRFETFDYSVNSFNSTAQVYELFDNRSYTTKVLLHNYPAFFNSIQVSLKDYFSL